ncbi:hsp70-binding protein 1-like [Acanthaster planci]|uniref:Hsp70-binding protein 1 n=1 Tax=Acanthaster planci TaxID=133434 RepID=A0A8B7XUA6_ACAPL|nr:hsp70-binding protein 1-like [Acanthaster planci]XP_022083591.1 hsp70-binding protein 1-like [Acanthaster planci]XP_022083592.1 hsp70-binding protein 1-like [Acanthaster planci]
MASSGDRQDGGSSGNQQRFHGTLEEVLRFAVENTPTGEGGTQGTEYTVMDPERREFLNKVFAEMNKDETREMISLVETLKQKLDSEKEDDEEIVEDALENLRDLCDTIDNAQDFHKIGGTQLLPRLMDHPRSEVRWRAFDLIANLVQNVPFNQEVLLEMGGVEKLLVSVDKDSSERSRVKALYALSCLVRDNEACQKVFAENDGFSVLMRAMQSKVEKLQIKSAFMLQALFQTGVGFKDTLYNMGMVQQLIGLLQTDHTPTHEHFMSALLNLITDHKDCISDCQQPELGFKEFLTARQEFLKGKPEFQEEYSHSQQVMSICFSGNHNNSSALDR